MKTKKTNSDTKTPSSSNRRSQLNSTDSHMILYCFALLNAYVCIVSVGVDMMVVGGIAILFHIFAFIIGYVMLSKRNRLYREINWSLCFGHKCRCFMVLVSLFGLPCR
jgi:hypothetical protein